jgi:hypothetical protein
MVTFIAESKDGARSFYEQRVKAKKNCWYGPVG